MLVLSAGCGGDDEDGDGGGDGDGDGDGGPEPDGGGQQGEVFCGNGTRDGDDDCEGNDGCADGEVCTATCTCEALPPIPTTSQGLIAEALARGDIDYGTSLVYRAWALFGDSRLPPEYDGEAWHWEDNGLFREAARVWDSLDAATQADLQPFLLRPSEPGSYHSPLENEGGPAKAPSPHCPYQPNADSRDWRSTASAGNHFVIWSCGGGDPAQDPYATQRATAGTIAEAVYSTMTPETGNPEPDDYPNVDGTPDGRIDLYLVQPNMCRERDGDCVAIPVTPGEATLAAAVGTRPCRAGRTGALASSSFFMVDVNQVPAGAGGASHFRYVVAHEFFHLIQNALNLEAQGGGCSGDGRVEDTVTSWLVEASAEWASAAYFAADWPQRRTDLFTLFQRRDPSLVSLQAIGGQLLDYQAFLYPLFVQQEKAGRTHFVDMWKTSGSARTPAQLDDSLNDLLPLSEHFRDFAVRNFNTTLPGAPIRTRYQALDGAITEGEKPRVLEPAVSLNFPTEYARSVNLQALTAQYEHFEVDEHIQSVRVDLQELQNSGFVQADVLANVGGTWELRPVPGLVFEFCREDPGDDIQAFYLIVSHHDRRQGAVAAGDYQVRTRFDCPSGWQGSIRFVHTFDDSYSRDEPAGDSSYVMSEREVQTWTVVGTEEVSMGPQTYDELSLHWSATYQRNSVTDFAPTACLGDAVHTVEEMTGSGDGTDIVGVFAAGAGNYSMTPTELVEHDIDCVGSVSWEYCTGETAGDALTDTRYDYIGALFAQVQGLAALAPDEEGGRHYTGSATILHSELPEIGGQSILDQSVTWDFTRR